MILYHLIQVNLQISLYDTLIFTPPSPTNNFITSALFHFLLKPWHSFDSEDSLWWLA